MQGARMRRWLLSLERWARRIIRDGLPNRESNLKMRERDREIKRRRQRYQKRKKLRQQLAATTADAEQQKIEAKIRKTYPTFTPAP